MGKKKAKIFEPNSIELALIYMSIIYNNGELNQLYHILSDKLDFKGPLNHYTSSKDYIQALKADPPIGFEYEMNSMKEEGNKVILDYIFKKPGVELPMKQIFEIEEGKIKSIELEFDKSTFESE